MQRGSEIMAKSRSAIKLYLIRHRFLRNLRNVMSLLQIMNATYTIKARFNPRKQGESKEAKYMSASQNNIEYKNIKFIYRSFLMFKFSFCNFIILSKLNNEIIIKTFIY